MDKFKLWVTSNIQAQFLVNVPGTTTIEQAKANVLDVYQRTHSTPPVEACSYLALYHPHPTSGKTGAYRLAPNAKVADVLPQHADVYAHLVFNRSETPQLRGAAAKRREAAANKRQEANKATPASKRAAEAASAPAAKRSRAQAGPSPAAAVGTPQANGATPAPSSDEEEEAAQAAVVDTTATIDKSSSSGEDTSSDDEDDQEEEGAGAEAAAVTAATAASSSSDEDSSSDDEDDDDKEEGAGTRPAAAAAASSDDESSSSEDGSSADTPEELGAILAGTVGGDGAQPVPKSPPAGSKGTAAGAEGALSVQRPGDITRYYPPTVAQLMSKAGTKNRTAVRNDVQQLVRDVLNLEKQPSSKDIQKLIPYSRIPRPAWWPEHVAWATDWVKGNATMDTVYDAAFTRLRALSEQ